MENSEDIIGIAQKLITEMNQGWGRSYARKTEWLEQVKFHAPDLITALLEQQERLRALESEKIKFARSIALQSLGLTWAEMFPTEVLPSQQLIQIVETVLSPTRSSPTI